MKLTVEEKEILAIENEKLIFHMVNKFKFNSIEEEELISAAHLGFTCALNAFDKDKGIKLSTFVCKCIFNELVRLKEREERRQRLKYISLDFEGNDEFDKSWHEVLESNDEDITIAEINLIVERTKKRLDARRGLVLQRLVEGKNRTDIAKELGRTSEAVRKLIIKIQKELIKEMGK